MRFINVNDLLFFQSINSFNNINETIRGGREKKKMARFYVTQMHNALQK